MANVMVFQQPREPADVSAVCAANIKYIHKIIFAVICRAPSLPEPGPGVQTSFLKLR